MESSTRSASTRLTEPLPNGGSRARQICAGIHGLGSCAPSRVLTNQDLERIVDTNDEWIVSRTGISERRIAPPDQATSHLASIAAERALADAGLPASAVDLVIVATVTGDYPFPATASIVQHRIGATAAAAFDLGAACSGFIYALSVGAQFIQTGAYRHVLVIGAETLSRIVNWRDRATCVLFGDGAGAVLLGPAAENRGFMAFDLGSDGGGADMLAVKKGGWGHPLTTGSDHEIQHSIQMLGTEVFKFAVRVIEDSTRRAVARAGLALSDIDTLIPHQANIRIIDAAAKRLGLEGRVYHNVARYGNTSAASIPLAMDEARSEGRLRPGDTLALVGFGAGLTWASCVVQWGGAHGAAAAGKEGG